jgi:Ala-tRNA(Pro) deacylase
MLHLDLSRGDALGFLAFLDAKLVELKREVAFTDTRRLHHELVETATVVGRVIEQLSHLLNVQTARAQGAGERLCVPHHDALSRDDIDERTSVPDGVVDYLREHLVNYAVIHHKAAYTARQEAAAAHVAGHEWAKAVVCVADERPTLAVLPADHMIDLARLRDLAGTRRLRLATEAEMATLYLGCELGAMPPLGPLFGQRVFVDESVRSNTEIAFSAGSHREAIRMCYRDFERLVQPTIGTFSRMH